MILGKVEQHLVQLRNMSMSKNYTIIYFDTTMKHTKDNVLYRHKAFGILCIILYLIEPIVSAQNDSILIEKQNYKLFDNGIFEIYGTNRFDTNITWIYTMGIWKYAGGDTIALKSYEKYKPTLYSAREFVDANSDDIVFEIYATSGNLLTINRWRKDSNPYSPFQYDYECDTCMFIGAGIDITNTDYVLISLTNCPLVYKICDKRSNRFKFIIKDACDDNCAYINAIYKICEKGLMFIKKNDFDQDF